MRATRPLLQVPPAKVPGLHFLAADIQYLHFHIWRFQKGGSAKRMHHKGTLGKNTRPELTAAIVVDMRAMRCDHCKVAVHDDLATQCAVCRARFDSIVSNHVGMAAKLERKRAQAGVHGCTAR